jgi:hypothetical protein
MHPLEGHNIPGWDTKDKVRANLQDETKQNYSVTNIVCFYFTQQWLPVAQVL